MWYKLKRIMMRPNGVEKQVRPKWWWKPWANTVLYLPLDWDVVDYSSAWRTFTVYWPSASVGTPVFDTLANWKKVADFTASNDANSNRFAFTSDVTGIPTSWDLTLSYWMNQTWITNGYQNIVAMRDYAGGTYYWSWMTWTGLSSDNRLFWHGQSSYYTSFQPTAWTWYNIVCVVDNGTCYVYKDRVQIYTSSYTYGQNVSQKLCLCGYYYPNNPSYRSETYNGKLSEVIIENVARTAQEVTDYYDQTKANYWL